MTPKYTLPGMAEWPVLHRQDACYVALTAAQADDNQANDCHRAEFIYRNLVLETNVIHAAFIAGVQRLMFLGSAGKPESSHEPHAAANTPRERLDESRLRGLGWQASYPVRAGLEQVYRWYTGHAAESSRQVVIAG